MTLLQIDRLTVEMPDVTARPILDEVTLSIDSGEIVGLVGESGSGKSTSARAVLGLLPQGSRATGEVRVGGTSVLDADAAALRRIRTREVAMVFQDPRAAVNPARRVGDFLRENLCRNLGRPRADATRVGWSLLRSVGIDDPERLMRQYPHQLSGGMLQRVVIAAALTGEPSLLLADEATSALDATTQAETLALLRRLQQERGLGMLIITHDLHLAAAFCDRVYVMYAGTIVEEQRGAMFFEDPKHPYTKALVACTPTLDGRGAVEPLPGRPLSLDEPGNGCLFAARCPHADPACSTWTRETIDVDGALVTCRRVFELSPRSVAERA